MSFAAHLVPLFSDRLRPVSHRALSDAHARAQEHAATNLESSQDQRQRGVIGYHNPFKDPSTPDTAPDDTPPSYHTTHRSRLPRRYSFDDAPIPDYDCSVFCDGRIDLKIERKTPFDVVEDPKWEPVYAILQGTILNVHAIKSSNPLAMAANPSLPDRRAGKLIRSYTLQHAEAGLAADYKKYELVPRSQLTYLLSASAQRQLQLTEPNKFARVYQYVIRLRLEGQQILLRLKTSTDRTIWLNNITAAIDIAPPLEARNEPKYITLPRRRRRRAAPGETVALDALREQQARIIRDHYPQLADVTDEQAEPDTVQDFDDGRHPEPGAAEGAEREAEPDEELQAPVPPAVSIADGPTQISGLISQVNRIFDAHAGPAIPRIRVHVRPSSTQPRAATRERTDFDDEGKWAPYLPIDLAQESRIRRRCMPSLLFNSKRASDIIMVQGKRVQIDAESQSLKPWSGAPPTYNEVQESTLSASPSQTSPHNSQARHTLARPNTPRQSSRNLLLRVRSTPERRTPECSESSHATGATHDDVASSDGSSHYTPIAKNFLSRTANKLRRMTSRQQDVPSSHNPKRNSCASSQAAIEQETNTDMRKIQSQMTGVGSTTSLTAAGGGGGR